MIRLPVTRRCRATHYHRRRDTGEAIKVQCERERAHRGDHYWWPDTWAACTCSCKDFVGDQP